MICLDTNRLQNNILPHQLHEVTDLQILAVQVLQSLEVFGVGCVHFV